MRFAALLLPILVIATSAKAQDAEQSLRSIQGELSQMNQRQNMKDFMERAQAEKENQAQIDAFKLQLRMKAKSDYLKYKPPKYKIIQPPGPPIEGLKCLDEAKTACFKAQ